MWGEVSVKWRKWFGYLLPTHVNMSSVYTHSLHNEGRQLTPANLCMCHLCACMHKNLHMARSEVIEHLPSLCKAPGFDP